MKNAGVLGHQNTAVAAWQNRIPDLIIAIIATLVLAGAQKILVDAAFTWMQVGSFALVVLMFQFILLRHVSTKAEHRTRCLCEVKAKKQLEQANVQLEEKLAAVQAELEQEKSQRLAESEQREKTAQLVHGVAHFSRDLLVKLLPHNRRRDRLPNRHAVKAHHADLIRVMTVMKELFSVGEPASNRVWIGYRELRPDGRFHTVMRVGNAFQKERQRFTEPLKPDSDIVRALRAAYGKEKRDCVIWTGSDQPNWDEMTNNELGENKSVLLGAVFSKTWDGENFNLPIMTGILSANSNLENVFNDPVHKELMKACNDQFSAIVNILARIPDNDRRAS